MINYGYAWLIEGLIHIFLSIIDLLSLGTFLQFGCLNDLGRSSQAIFSHMWNVMEFNFVLI